MAQTNFRAIDMSGTAKSSVAKPAHKKVDKPAKKVEKIVEPIAEEIISTEETE